LRAEKSHYTFPSTILQQTSNDEIYQDLYYGQPIIVTDNGAVSFNIPMDATEVDWNQSAKQKSSLGWQMKLQKLGWYAFIAGTIWSLIMASLSPSIANLLIAGLYMVLVAVMLWYRHRHPWGVIYNHAHQPVAGAVVTLYDLENPQISRPPVVTSASGRYAFLTDKGKYQLGVAIKNAAGTVWPVVSTPPLKQTSSQGHIAQDIQLPD
jgi:hypothetical protein